MASDVRIIVSLACGQCQRRNYSTYKNRRNSTTKLELKKYCRYCKCHTQHKEGK